MCIILTCAPNVRPSHDMLETCFWNNPDGAGLMWIENGKVQTSKGYEYASDLLGMVDSIPTDSPLCVHMRIATSGGIDGAVCHPFPVCDSLEALHALDVECGAALMHNGVIAGMPTDEKQGISDTVSFVSSVVAPIMGRRAHVTRHAAHVIRDAAPGNRFAILTSDGAVTRIGAGWQTVRNGIYASNDSWRRDRWAHLAPAWSYDRRYDYEYADVIEDMCDGCSMCATCAAYGPICDDIADDIEQMSLDDILKFSD